MEKDKGMNRTSGERTVYDWEMDGRSKRLRLAVRFKSKISLVAPRPISVNSGAPSQSRRKEERILRRM
jgi:hypothetical protein